jgi:heme/copper-type cytochrome/quinol oxidase subunit 2
MALDTGTSIAAWAAFGVAVVTVIAGVVTWAVGQHRSQSNEDAGPKASTADSSWRVTVLALFGVTVTLAALAVLSATRTNTAGHFSTTDVFTDLAGAGALLSGVGTMLVFAAGYWGRRKRSNQQTNAEVLNRAIARIDHSLTPEDIHALADLARAVHGSEDSAKEDKPREIVLGGTPATTVNPPANGKAEAQPQQVTLVYDGEPGPDQETLKASNRGSRRRRLGRRGTNHQG